MTFNISCQREQQQRIANDAAAMEHRIELESIEGIKKQGREDGRVGKFPVDPKSLFYYSAWAEGYREYAIAEKEREFNADWSDIAF